MLRSRLLQLAPRSLYKNPRRSHSDGDVAAQDYEYDESQFTGISYYFNKETPRGRINNGRAMYAAVIGTAYYFGSYRPKQKKKALEAEAAKK